MVNDLEQNSARGAHELELTIDFHLLGVVGFHPVRALQQRLVAEAIAGRAAVRMASVRIALIESLVEVWRPRQFHIHAGHPRLPADTDNPRRRKILTKGEL